MKTLETLSEAMVQKFGRDDFERAATADHVAGLLIAHDDMAAALVSRDRAFIEETIADCAIQITAVMLCEGAEFIDLDDESQWDRSKQMIAHEIWCAEASHRFAEIARTIYYEFGPNALAESAQLALIHLSALCQHIGLEDLGTIAHRRVNQLEIGTDD